jgi:hypothetical protein
MSAGYVYCITNPSMPDLVKIGVTSRPLEERLDEANSNSTWTPFPYKVEFAKWVAHAEHRELTLHRIFHAQRVNPKREWFRVPVETVRLHFELMDGSLWTEAPAEAETPLSKSMSQEIVHQFLNETVYPSVEDTATEWTDVVRAFQAWKKRNGHHYGNIKDLQTTLFTEYGRPPWSDIRIKTESPA